MTRKQVTLQLVEASARRGLPLPVYFMRVLREAVVWTELDNRTTKIYVL